MLKKGDIHELVSESRGASCPKDQLLRFVNVDLICVQEHAIDRPTMSEVISMLSNDAVDLPAPKQPAYCLSKTETEFSSDGKLEFGSVNRVSVTVMEAR